MPREDYWRFDGVPIDGHAGPEETRTVGESATLPVYLTPDSDSPRGAWPDYVERYRGLRQYRPHAGAFASGVDINQRPWYREQHDRSPSLLVSVRPPADTRTGVGGWFLVVAVADATTLPSALCQMEFDLLYLGALDEYADADAVRAALEADGI